jgi:hypothetical protein
MPINTISSRFSILFLSIVLAGLLVWPAEAQTLAEKYDLPRLLDKSILWYEHQVSGVKPAWNRSYWRGDAQLNAGADVGVNLTGGWNDAGDNVKFNFPQAHAVVILAWTRLDYADDLARTEQTAPLERNLRWALDYLLRCTPAATTPAATVIWGQVGNGQTDHSFWLPPERINYSFPTYKLDATNPGTDLAMEYAAAFAAGHLVFRDTDPAYAATLLARARQCFAFGDTYRGEYSDVITDAFSFYQSFSGYQDEISWAAAWLYRATGETPFLTRAQNEHFAVSGYAPAWDNKGFANSILLYQLTGTATYRNRTESWLNSILPGAGRTYTPGGLLWLQQFGPLPLAVAGAWGALHYTKIAGPTGTSTSALYTTYRNWALGQLDYALGANPAGRCYVAGLRDNSFLNFHHRGASGLIGYVADYGNTARVNTYVLEGGLAGGPAADDSFQNNRSNPSQSEAGVSTNCYLTAAAAALVDAFNLSAPARPALGRAPADPVLDGAADSSYGRRHALSRVLVGGATPAPADLAATWAAQWTPTHLYLHVAVRDDVAVTDTSPSTRHQDDSIELYVDRLAAGFSTYGAAANPPTGGTGFGAPAVFQFVFTRGDPTFAVFGLGGTTAGITAIWRSTANGYELELACPWSALGGPRAAADLVGLDVQVNDDDDGGDRDAKLAWAGTTDVSWRRPDNFGRVVLAAAAAEQTFADYMAAALGGASAADPAADPDLDARSNLLEYALGSDPTRADAANPAPAALASGPSLELTASVLARATDLNLRVQASADLIIWTDLAVATRGGAFSPATPIIADTTTGDRRTFTVRDSAAPTPRRFLRLQAELAP